LVEAPSLRRTFQSFGASASCYRARLLPGHDSTADFAEVWAMSIARLITGVAISVGAMLTASASWALDRNGNWWLAQSSSDRVIYIIGFFDGVEFELDQARMLLKNPYQALLYPQPCDEACIKLRLDQAFTNWKRLQEQYEEFDGVTAGQLVAGVDAMVSDYRNRGIAIKDILGVVMWSIKGVKQDVIDGRITYLRSQK
jgi:hypothetical protein